jgi:hypothetical protein
MPLNKALIDILACPKCKGALVLAADESEFRCSACRLAFAVEDGIPNFIIEDAREISSEGGS